jgi:hypothetical protein
MNTDQLRTLSQWAEGLARDDRPEVRAAAKAILILVEEVESLRAALLTEMPPDEVVTVFEPAVDGGSAPEQEVASDLRARLRGFARERFHFL